MKHFDLIVIGGGAAGFFTAINAAILNPDLSVALFEKGNQFLGKVKVSGGGRCNVTHACFEPKELVKFYPRGYRELLGPFHSFQPGDTFEWFQSRGVELKIEDDNRVFPESDNSQTIIDCFLSEAKKYGVELQLQTGAESFEQGEGGWKVLTNRGEFSCKSLVVATGSSPQVWKQIGELGLTIVPAVPSLFTFNVKHPAFDGLMGVSLPNAEVRIPKGKLSASGPFLFTHWGFSGPAVLRLSAWGAEFLAKEQYNFDLLLNFLPNFDRDQLSDLIKDLRLELAKKNMGTHSQFGLPTKLWQGVVTYLGLSECKWADLNNKQAAALVQHLMEFPVKANGKSTFKEEFVTCGGVDLREIDFKTMECKKFPGLYFCGEVLNIDAITGGFNFQAAWTEAYIAAKAISGT